MQVEARCSSSRIAGMCFQRVPQPDIWATRQQQTQRPGTRANGRSSSRPQSPRATRAAITGLPLMGAFWPPYRPTRGSGQFNFDNAAQLLESIMREFPVAQGVRGWDVKETKEAWVLKLEVPGYGAEDINVQVEEKDDVKYLSISSKRQSDSETDSSTRTVMSSALRIRSPLPDTIHVSGITADVSKGLLTVTLPKVQPEESKPKVVNVTVRDGERSSATSADSSSSTAIDVEQGSGSGDEGEKKKNDDNNDLGLPFASV